MKVDPKHLILDLLLAVGDKPLTVRHAILACSLFNISENSLRVTLARLSAAGLIDVAGRGAYRLGPAAIDLAGDVSTWRTIDARLRAWAGGYLVVHSAALGRSDRVLLRRRERALGMLGFREFERGLYIRPDNFSDDIEQVRQRLYKLGLDRDAAVFRADGFDPAREAAIRHLWDGNALTQTYRRLRGQLDDWLAGADRLTLDVAARESFILGGQAIHALIFDPLLPQPFVDAGERDAFVQAIRRFDDSGRTIWNRFFASVDESAPPLLLIQQPVQEPIQQTTELETIDE